MTTVLSTIVQTLMLLLFRINKVIMTTLAGPGEDNANNIYWMHTDKYILLV